jgi:hypothetical protein
MIINPLNWQPTHPQKWCARGILQTYCVKDNGLWEIDAENSGPDEAEADLIQREEEKFVWNLLTLEAQEKLKDLL